MSRVQSVTKDIPKNTFEPLNQDNFAKIVTDGIRKAGATADIVYDRERFCLSQGDKDGPMLFLANAYDEYCSAPEPMRSQILQKYVRTWFWGQSNCRKPSTTCIPTCFLWCEHDPISTWPN